MSTRALEWMIERLLFVCAALSVLTTAGIILVLAVETFEFLREVSIVEFLTGTEWTPLFANRHFGVLPLVAGTMLVSTIAMVVAIPMGVLAAIYLSEYAPNGLRRVIKPVLELLAGVPTVVYGYFALTFVTPLLQTFLPQLSGFNALSPGLVMGLMILPLVSSLSEDAMRAVPNGLREGSYALGATRMQTALKVVVPGAFSGITAAFILAASRAIGEHVVDQRAERGQGDHQRRGRDDLEDEVGVLPHAYSSRNRSRSQVLIKFRPKVIANSSMPTAKMVRYSSVPCGVSPRLTCTM